MAMEIEYVDVGSETIDADQASADPADIINGDGLNEQTAEGILEPETDNQEEVSDSGEPDTGELPEESPGEELSEEELAERRAAVELAYEQEIAGAKEEHFSLAVRRSEGEASLKELKADEKAALKNLKNLIRRGPNYPQPTTKIEQAVAEGGERSAITVDDPSADDSWKLISLASLLDGIKGLGDKKRDAITALAPTLADWEELRARAGIAHKPLASVLPRGVGGELADVIEERVFSAVKKHCDSQSTPDTEHLDAQQPPTENSCTPAESAVNPT